MLPVWAAALLQRLHPFTKATTPLKDAARPLHAPSTDTGTYPVLSTLGTYPATAPVSPRCPDTFLDLRHC